ncbi:MAG: HAMP domain-containing sensor histidine kinase, partial [Campylobacterota bacterium]|nr:HAMP domain-containing sensor histidine kinase [Campylobacterota bacterium]
IIIFDVDMVDGKLLIKIIDNANGIPLDIIDKIFKANFTSKESLGGTGIGLYLSKQIVEKLNGTIEAKNLEYEYNGNSYYGACFEIKI